MVKKSNNYRWKILLPVIISGLIVVLILAYSYDIGIQMTYRYAPLVNTAMEIKLEATSAHLWFEEILSGDRQEDMESVWQNINDADWYAKAMLEGGQNSEGIFLVLEDEEMRNDIINVRKKLAEFRIATQKRFEEKETSAAGTDIDQKYDIIFKDFIQQADIVESRLQQLMIKDLQSFRIIQISLIIMIILFTIFVGIILNRYEIRKFENMDKLKVINKLLSDEITEHKQAEEELKKHREHPEELVEERIAELNKLNEDLLEKNEELEKYNDLFVGREFRIKELKNKIEEMEKDE